MRWQTCPTDHMELLVRVTEPAACVVHVKWRGKTRGGQLGEMETGFKELEVSTKPKTGGEKGKQQW